VVPGADADALPGLLVEHVRERLAPFKVPKAVRLVEGPPRNASGKVLKRELRDRPVRAGRRIRDGLAGGSGTYRVP